MDTLEKNLIEAQKEIEKAQNALKLKKQYPDLKQYEGRWGKKVLCSASVNSLVTDYESRFNCGCCHDSPYEIWPYLETELGRVYSDPARFFVGEKGYGYFYGEGGPRVQTYGDWQKDLEKSGINPAVVDKIKQELEEYEERE